jgi:predicted dehydrogenase
MKDKPTRRGFLKMAGVAAAVGATLSSVPRRLRADDIVTPTADTSKFMGGQFPAWTGPASSRPLGANDRINFAVIGCGGQGFGAHVKGLKKEGPTINTKLVGCCDVYNPRIERAKAEMEEAGGPTVIATKDYRKILESKDVDAVVVATPEHWHAQISVHAMEAGKHVYSEKPMTRYIDEAFQMLDTSKKTGKLCQLGTQYASDPKWHAIGDAIRGGKIGKLVSGQSSYARNAGSKGEWNYNIEEGAGPDNLDWDLWLGACPKRPWNDDSKARFFRYRKYWDYSGGILGDLMPHKISPFLIASGNPEYPTRVSCLGTREISTDREVDDNVIVTATFPSGWTMMFVGSTVNEQGLPDLFRGHKASIQFGGEGAKALPERPFAEEIDEFVVAKASGAGVPEHHANFVGAIRGLNKQSADVELGCKVQAVVSMAEMSSRLKKEVHFDEKTRTISPA